MAQTPHPRVQPPPPPQDEETDEQKRLRAQKEEAETRAAAEAATAHLPKQGDPRQPPMSAAEAAPDEATTKMNFPHPVTLTLPGYRMVHFPEGIQEVPESMVDHEYLAAHGVTKI